MGGNTYITAVKALGYSTESAATAIIQNIDPRSGERIAIRAFGLTSGATITAAYFMQALGVSTITAAVASNATTGLIATAEFQTAANPAASSDYIAIELDSGAFQYTTIATGLYTGFSIDDNLTDTVAAGNKVWGFGVAADTGHYRIQMAASVQTARSEDGGIAYANAKNYPMKVYHVNNAALAGSIDYVTVDYINK